MSENFIPLEGTENQIHFAEVIRAVFVKLIDLDIETSIETKNKELENFLKERRNVYLTEKYALWFIQNKNEEHKTIAEKVILLRKIKEEKKE